METTVMMTDEEARKAVLEYFRVPRRTSDLLDDHIVDGWDGDHTSLVRILYAAGLLRHLRGRTRGKVYVLSDAGRAVLDIPGF